MATHHSSTLRPFAAHFLACNYKSNKLGGPQGTLEIPLSRRFVALITPRNCLRFKFTPNLPNHAGCQIDHSRNNAILSIQFPFSRSKICRITPSRFPFRSPSILFTICESDKMFTTIGNQ